MDNNPLSEVRDRPIKSTSSTLEQLNNFLSEEKFTELPGINNEDEKKELSALINKLLVSLIKDLSSNPTKMWVMQQFCMVLQEVEEEDTEVRDHFAEHMEKIMDILEIESSDDVLGFYLGYV